MKFKFLKHTADIKFQAFGKSIDEAFENSALALANTMYSGKVAKVKKKKIKVEGKDYESLLYNFLEEILFLLDSEGFFVSDVKVFVKDFSLVAEVFGDNSENYKIGLDVKAITYNEMFVKNLRGKWVCQVVLDV